MNENEEYADAHIPLEITQDLPEEIIDEGAGTPSAKQHTNKLQPCF